MSWQENLDKILAKHECHLAFIGSRDTGEAFAKYENGLPSEITQFEIKIICDQMGSSNLIDQFRQFGINLGGERYACLRAQSDKVIGRLGPMNLFIYTTNNYIVAAASTDVQVVLSVEKLVEYLILLQ